ncbi:MBG domain-containing protein [Lactiplantibacillus herbarum]|uniref:MBG domain-containing protein n=1 Tax=Lactiplantibacillus herbarum TaxID=1670446 RepID=UPI00064FBFB0|nr:MBG domain-containing protein [Lactiplantibacillus herbarum]
MWKRRRNLKTAEMSEKRTYKMYKKGRIWIIAGISTFTIGMGGLRAQASETTSAATSSTSTDSSSTATSSTAKAVTLKTSAIATTSTTSSSDSTTDKTSSSSTASSTSSSSSSTSAASSSSSESAASSSSESSSTVSTSSVSKTAKQSETSEAATASSASSKSAATSASSSKQTATATKSVTKLSRAVSAATTSTIVTVNSTSKTYDGTTSTPNKYTVTLAAGTKAASGWASTSVANVYTVTDITDIDTTQFSAGVGTYTIALSSSGLAKLNKANTGTDLTAANVVTGTLTIGKAPVPTGSITVESTSVNYGDDLPASYTVDVPVTYAVPSDWTYKSTSSDGLTKIYTIASNTGDLTPMTNTAAGTYTLSLTAQGLSKLQAANPNYAINSSSVNSGQLMIKSHAIVTIGTATSVVAAGLPSNITISVASNYVVPSDWTVFYNNTAQSSIVYTVPRSYIDITNVDRYTIGNYSVMLTDAAIETLAAANPTVTFDSSDISAGAIQIVAKTSGTVATPSNFYATVGIKAGYTSNSPSNYTSTLKVAYGSTLFLQLRLLNFAQTTQVGTVVNNISDYVIIPAGFAVATKNADGTYSTSTDPTATLKAEIESMLAATGTTYGDVTVTKLADYNGRQTFAIQFAYAPTYNTLYNTTYYTETPIIATYGSGITSGAIGTDAASQDSAVLYATDDASVNGGSYTFNLYGYANVPQVADALGISDAVTGLSQYYAYIYHFQLFTAQVEDTYQLVSTNGDILADNVTFTGNSGTTYNPLTKLPSTIVKDGVTYYLRTSAVPTTQTYDQITSSVTEGSVVAGQTYVAYYEKYVEATTDATAVITIANQQKVYDNNSATDPAYYTVYLPSEYTAPADWTVDSSVPVISGSTAYKVAAKYIDTSAINQNAGSYQVTLNADGMADLAAANDGLLIAQDVNVGGTFTITKRPATITVTGGTYKYDGKNHGATGTVSGLADGDSLDYTLSAGQTAIGTYDMSATYTANDNYDVTVVDGTLDITSNDYQLTINYVDENGNVIKTAVTTGGHNYNDSYTTNASVIKGYYLVTTPSNANGTFTTLPSDVTSINTGDVSVTYSYRKLGSYVITGKDGSTTTIQYVNDPDDPAKIVTPTDSTVPYVAGYTPQVNGKDLTPVDATDLSKGYNYPTPVDPGTDTAISYQANTQTITVNLVDKNGNAVKNTAGQSTYTVTGKTDDTADFSGITTSDKLVKGYVLTKDGTTTTITYGDGTIAQIVNIVYTPVGSYQTTSPDGTTSSLQYPNDATDPTKIPTPADTTVPYVAGYTPQVNGQKLTPVDATDLSKGYYYPTPTSATEDTLISYTANKQTITVNLVDKNGNAVKNAAGQSSYTVTGTTGATADFSGITTSDKLVNGYVLTQDGTTITITYGDGTTAQVVNIVYTPVGSYQITDPKGSTSSVGYPNDTTDPTKVMTPTDSTVPYVAGYTPQSNGQNLTPVDVNDLSKGYYYPTPVSATEDTAISYTANKQTITVNLVDKNGNPVKNAAGQSSYVVTGTTGATADFSTITTSDKLVNGYVLTKDGTTTIITYSDGTTAQVVNIVYTKVGSYQITNPSGDKSSVTYPNDTTDPTKVTTPADSTVPYVKDYTPQANGKDLTPVDANDLSKGYYYPTPTSVTEDTVITYQQVKTVYPSEPSEPDTKPVKSTEPETPAKPDTSTDTETVVSPDEIQSETGDSSSANQGTTSGQVTESSIKVNATVVKSTTKATATSGSSTDKAATLPQTDEQSDQQLALLGLALMVLSGGVGIGLGRRRKRDLD